MPSLPIFYFSSSLSVAVPMCLMHALTLNLTFFTHENAKAGHLLHAVKFGSSEEVLACLDRGTDIESRDRVRFQSSACECTK